MASAIAVLGLLGASVALSADGGPRNVRVLIADPTALKIAFTPSGRDDRVAGYRVYVNGAPALATTSLIAWVQGLSCGTSYSIGVSAASDSAPTTSITASTAGCNGAPAPPATPTSTGPVTPTPSPSAPPRPPTQPTPPPPAPAPPTPTAPPSTPPSGSRSVVLVDQQWQCRGPVDLDLVKVTMRAGLDAVSLGPGCTGRVGRIEVDTWSADGIKIQNSGTVARDLVVESGYVKCYAIAAGAHQDGVQAMGGTRITFRGLTIDCLGNSNFFVNAGGSNSSTPTDVVCDGCILGPRSASNLFIATSIRSGARGTIICPGRSTALRIGAATSPLNSGNYLAPSSDPRCA